MVEEDRHQEGEPPSNLSDLRATMQKQEMLTQTNLIKAFFPMNRTISYENKNLMPHYVVKTYQTIASLEQIRPAWERLQRHPNADMDFFLTILQVRSNILRPHVITLEQASEIVAMLIGRIEQIELKCYIGYKALLHPRVRSLTIVHGGALGDTAGEHAPILVDSLRASLRQGEADVVMLSKLTVDCDLFQTSRHRPELLCRDLATTATPHWVIELPSSLDEIMQRFSSKRRNKFGRKERLFERSFPGQISYRLLGKPEEVATLCEDLEQVASLTYQRGLGAGFVNDEEHRQRLALAASRSQLCALVIYLKGRPCAFQLGTIHQETYHLIHTGFDPALHQYEIGTLALMKMIGHLCRRGIQRYDFGLGDADYKRELATTGWQEATIHIFAPRLRPVLINAVRELFIASASGMQSISSRLGLVRMIKRSWRKRLSQEGSETRKEDYEKEKYEKAA